MVMKEHVIEGKRWIPVFDSQEETGGGAYCHEGKSNAQLSSRRSDWGMVSCNVASDPQEDTTGPCLQLDLGPQSQHQVFVQPLCYQRVPENSVLAQSFFASWVK